MFFDAADQDDRNLEELEELVWDGNRAPPDQQIDQFMILARHADTYDIYDLSRWQLWCWLAVSK